MKVRKGQNTLEPNCEDNHGTKNESSVTNLVPVRGGIAISIKGYSIISWHCAGETAVGLVLKTRIQQSLQHKDKQLNRNSLLKRGNLQFIFNGDPPQLLIISINTELSSHSIL